MLVDPKITIAWWEELLKDEEKLVKWLQKLQVTEIDGYSGNFEANAKWNSQGSRQHEIFFISTARDELKHSNLLEELLLNRGHTKLASQKSTSIYWDKMEEEVSSLEEMCAAFYLGELLAAERFRVMSFHRETPIDIREFLNIALPDEEMHARGYYLLAGGKAIKKMSMVHDEVIKDLLGSRLNVT